MVVWKSEILKSLLRSLFSISTLMFPNVKRRTQKEPSSVPLCRPGVLTDNVEMFGNSWLEAEPQQAPCPTVPPDFPSPCAAVDDHVLLVNNSQLGTFCSSVTLERLQNVEPPAVCLLCVSAGGRAGLCHAAGAAVPELPQPGEPAVLHCQLFQRPVQVGLASGPCF